MDSLKIARQRRRLSQRRLAELAGVSFGSIQLIESKKHNSTIGTLDHVARTLGYPPNAVYERLESLFAAPPDSVEAASGRIVHEGQGSWKIWFFNFVDAFRRDKDLAYVESPPHRRTPEKIKALLASTVEMLCEEMKLAAPGWCAGTPPLNEPWFVSGLESLKPMALIESPAHFRKRHIFVFQDFLKRI